MGRLGLRASAIVCLLVFGVGDEKIMSDSLSEASKGATLGALAEYLSEPHLGVKLPLSLIGPLTLYIHTTLKMEDPEEVEEMGTGAFLAAVTECNAFRGVESFPAPDSSRVCTHVPLRLGMHNTMHVNTI